MNIKRLNRLITILERVKAEHLPFDMSEWIQAHSCGTRCCAMGYAALDADFQKEGLALEVGGVQCNTIHDYNATNAGFIGPTIRYKDCEQFAAVAAFFEIHRNLAYELFCEAAGITTTISQLICNIKQAIGRGASA